jgi:hypothetical protein
MKMQRDTRKRWPPRRVLDDTTRPTLIGDEAAAAADLAARKAASE